jgi:phosphoglycolate phosphatase
VTRLVLWDIDGTLIKAGAAGRLAFADAISEVIGRPVAPALLPRMAGKTDPEIALEILVEMGVDAPEDHLPAVEVALERALSARAGQIRAEGVVLPGVRAALRALAAAGAVQTLVTGNVAGNARTKLVAMGLVGEGGFDGSSVLRLDLGAYGSDDRVRDNLVPVAIGRARAVGMAVTEATTWVVGDTPRDLACARAAGVSCLLVASGGFPVDELEGLGADALLADLGDTERVLEILVG